MSDAVNPYAAPKHPTDQSGRPDSIGPVADESVDDAATQPASLRRMIAVWSAVGIVSAAPSFVVGLAITEGQFVGMVAGVATFVGLLVLIDFRTTRTTWRRRPLVRRTLRTVYITRLIVSLVFPVGMYIDMLCGFASVGLSSIALSIDPALRPDDHHHTFVFAYLTTLIQGGVIHVVMSVYGAAVAGVFALAGALKS